MGYFISLCLSTLLLAPINEGSIAENEISEVDWQKVAQRLILEIDVLKSRVEQQQNILDDLAYLRRPQHQRVTNQEKVALPKGIMGRTCEEIYLQDATQPSGNYSIDPDGPGGDEPFLVYCDMTTRTTIVGHDSENPDRIDQCASAGCHSRTINYNTTIRQLQILTQLSASCKQYIRFNCVGVPFEFNNVVYGFWNDRNNETRRYWAGRNLGEHICRCGLEKNCNDSSVMCNCDALLPEATFDDGYLTDLNDLPVMKLNFGRSSAISALGIHTLGKLECSGRPERDGLEDSCMDLWEAGVQTNGFYTFRKKMETENVNEFVTSYCDFSKLPEQETIFGSLDVKSQFAYFFAKDNALIPRMKSNRKITFADEELDYGDDFDDGVFTAPVSGFYFITFNVHNSKVNIVISTPEDPNLGEIIYETEGSFSAALKLQKGAEVSLTLVSDKLPEGFPKFFSGLLLKEIFE